MANKCLVDIANVKVDKNLPPDLRNIDFVRQMNFDPYHYISNGYEVTGIFQKNAPRLTDFVFGLVK